MPFVPEHAVAEVICLWAKRRLPSSSFLPRVNLRLIFGTPDLAARVRQELETESTAEVWYVVRSSADADAVACRNNRPPVRPAGVTDKTPLLYLLFWLPNQAGHEKNKESLADLPATTCWDVLSDTRGFVLPQEKLIEDRCQEAARAWNKAEAPTTHLCNAWAAVRTSVREGRGGREGTVPFFADIEAYVRFLEQATGPNADWQTMAPADKAARLVQRWGQALPALSLFRLPELASLLGIIIDPSVPVSKRDFNETWRARLTEILAENLDAAADFSQLADKIAGKSTVARQLEALAAQVQLCRGDAPQQRAAREALERFCQDGDTKAYELVDWQFREDPANRRSQSHGLRGVLIARRTRVRVSPQERAIQETLDLLRPLVAEGSSDNETLEPFIEQQGQAAGKDSTAARRLAELLRSLASRQIPDWFADPPLRDALGRVARSEGLQAAPFDIVAARWEKMARDDEDEVVHSGSLLLGLARLCAARLTKSAVGPVLFPGSRPAVDERLSLRVPSVGDGKIPALDLPVAQWDETTRERIRLWLRDSVVAGLQPAEEGEEEDETETETCELEVEVRREAAGRPSMLGVIVLNWSPRLAELVALSGQGLASWCLDTTPGVRSDLVLLRRLFKEPPRNEACPETVAQACHAYRKAVGDTEKNWAVTALAGPAPAAARGWVEAWASALELEEGEEAADPTKLMEEAQRAVQEGRQAEGLELMKRAQALMTSRPSRRGPTVEGVRGLLRVCTGSMGLDRLVLTPHHPLVLRLRLVGDDLLTRILHVMWSEGWPESALEELQDALRDWGWPEPLQFYGWWVGKNPLAFEGWVRDAGFAWFGDRGSRQTIDLNAPGVGEVANNVRRYRELFPMAADRLRLRVRADAEGRWAGRALDSVLRGDGPFRADIDLETTLGQGEPTALETAWQQDYDRRCALEMSDDGTVPRVRIRRRGSAQREPVHLNLVLGDVVEAFAEQQVTTRVQQAQLGMWDVAVLYALQRPELRPNRFIVNDPPDELCRRVGLAVAFAYNESRSDVFVRQCAFDPAVVRPPLEDLHKAAHWLILASRQPLHRAVQQAGEAVASLLDFRTLTERGRSVHVCVSVGTSQFGGDLARLEGLLRLLTGEQGAVGKPFVQAARRFAPRLALSCAGASSLTEIEGLLGLLLTQDAVRQEQNAGILLALDQHRGLLSGRGRRGDIVRLRMEGDKLWIGMAESKFSRNMVASDHGVVEDARDQLRTTRERLKHFTTAHPLVPRVRAALARAIIDQIHLSEVGPARSDELLSLLAATISSRTQVELEPDTAAVAHVWSLDPGTQDEMLAEGGAPRVSVHGRSETLRRFRELVGIGG
jgi:hypothetical protein